METSLRPPLASDRLWRLLVLLALGVALLALASPASAAVPPLIEDMFRAIDRVSGDMQRQVTASFDTPQLERIGNVLFTTIALGLFVTKFAGFALRGFDLLDIMEVVLTISLAYILMQSYQTLIPAIFSAGQFVGNTLGAAIVDAPEGMTLAQALFTTIWGMTLHGACDGVFDLSNCVIGLLSTLLGWAAVITLGIAALIAELWIIWGYLIAYALGWLFIAFLMIEWLAFLFEGWLKFFFGMIIYGFLVKVTLALVLLAFVIMERSHPGSTAAVIQVHNLRDLTGLFLFVFVGIFSLVSSGTFASSMVMGAGGGGINTVVGGIKSAINMAQEVIKAVAVTVATAGAGAGAGAASAAGSAGSAAGSAASSGAQAGASAGASAAQAGAQASAQGTQVGAQAGSQAAQSGSQAAQAGSQTTQSGSQAARSGSQAGPQSAQSGSQAGSQSSGPSQETMDKARQLVADGRKAVEEARKTAQEAQKLASEVQKLADRAKRLSESDKEE